MSEVKYEDGKVLKAKISVKGIQIFVVRMEIMMNMSLIDIAKNKSEVPASTVQN